MREAIQGHLLVVGVMVLMVWAFILQGCGPNAEQIAAANAVARGGNAVVTELVAAYEQQGLKAIDGAANADEAHAALERVRSEWKPVWLAYEALRQAHERYADALERGEPVDSMALLSSWCALVREADGVKAAARVRQAVGELPICPEQVQ